MQRLKKIPFLLGWLIFYLSSLLSSWLFGLWVSPFLGRIFPQLTPVASFILMMALVVIVGFFVFGFSVGKVVLPLYQNRETSVADIARITFWPYLLRWFLYLFFYVVYCIPLSFHGLLPAEIEKPIYLVWQILASFLAYRGVVRSWLDDFILQHKRDDENQVAIA